MPALALGSRAWPLTLGFLVALPLPLALACPVLPLAQPVGLALCRCNLWGLRADRTPTGRQLPPPPQRERTRATRYAVLWQGVFCPRNPLKGKTPL